MRTSTPTILLARCSRVVLYEYEYTSTEFVLLDYTSISTSTSTPTMYRLVIVEYFCTSMSIRVQKICNRLYEYEYAYKYEFSNYMIGRPTH